MSFSVIRKASIYGPELKLVSCATRAEATLEAARARRQLKAKRYSQVSVVVRESKKRVSEMAKAIALAKRAARAATKSGRCVVVRRKNPKRYEKLRKLAAKAKKSGHENLATSMYASIRKLSESTKRKRKNPSKKDEAIEKYLRGARKNPYGSARKSFYVVRVGGRDSDTHAASTLRDAMDIAMPDPGDRVEVKRVYADDPGWARLAPGGRWRRIK